MRKVSVIGVGMVKVDHHWKESLRSLFTKAAISALEDAGNPEVEALYIGNMSAGQFNKQENIAPMLADAVGLESKPSLRVEEGCSSGGAALFMALEAVASGIYDFVLVGGVEKMVDASSSDVTFILSTVTDQEYEAFTGLSLAGINAMVMRLYMNKFGATRESFAKFVVQMHDNASKNPYAQLPFKITVEKALNSIPVAEPLHLMDCAPVGDGAAALVICSADRAKEYTSDPVDVVGAWKANDTFLFHTRKDFLSLKATVEASKMAYEMAKITPEDVDVAEVHDSFSIAGILAIEDLGFARKGEGWKIVEEGLISLDGEIPINPSGGLKARGHPVGATGIYQAAEIVLQLRGEAGKRQVPDARIGVTHNTSGFGTSAVVHVFKAR
ncbi:MAG: thiolase domain-containing protein [Candidatus Jordarchaeales archaeon]